MWISTCSQRAQYQCSQKFCWVKAWRIVSRSIVCSCPQVALNFVDPPVTLTHLRDRNDCVVRGEHTGINTGSLLAKVSYIWEKRRKTITLYTFCFCLPESDWPTAYFVLFLPPYRGPYVMLSVHASTRYWISVCNSIVDSIGKLLKWFLRQRTFRRYVNTSLPTLNDFWDTILNFGHFMQMISYQGVPILVFTRQSERLVNQCLSLGVQCHVVCSK